jgi:hypothetical protein
MRLPSAAFACGVAIGLLPVCARAADGWLVLGPMIHRNLGAGGGSAAAWSFGLEASYWTAAGGALGGIDAGFEYDTRMAFRLYGEAESGIGLAGVGGGPVLESDSGRIRLGLQGSGWINCYAGSDYRIRWLAGRPPEFAPGLYLKFPVQGDFRPEFNGGQGTGWGIE